MSTPPDGRPTWVTIDLGAFERNVETLCGSLPEGSRLVAVLKADAYGHGAVELARRCSPARVAMIATSLLEESLELREAGIELPLLVLGPLDEHQVALAAEREITIGIPGPEEAAAACRVARDRDVRAHLKIDSGMGRMGVTEWELPEVVSMLQAAPRLRIEAIYTHLANADDPEDPFTADQIGRFETLVKTLKSAGIEAPLHHVANSAATARGLVRGGDYVRAGLALYGAEPVRGWRLEPLMRWRTAIARIKELPAGHAVGYGSTWRAAVPSRIATLPVGYADGYRRALSNRGEVLVRGRRAPVVGRVSMDLVTIDVTAIPEAGAGDEVILLGRQGGEEIPVEELASKVDTIAYEVFCGVSARVPRLYGGTAEAGSR